MKDYFPKRNSRIGETAFEVKNINRGSKVINVSFSVRSGEVLGLAGLVGAGRTETIRAIIGADKRDSGTVIVNNKEVHIRSPKNAFDHGIGFLSEDRKGEGVLLEMPIRYNTTLSSLKKYLNRIGVIKKKCETEDIKNIVGKLRIKAPSIETVLFNLSGGNQQKVALSRLLMSGCNVFLFDEPTRGVDVGAKREIYMLMNQLAEAGNAIIMVSSETPEILGMCDRVVVMYEGTVTGVVDKEDLSEKHIISYAMGVKEL